MEPDTLAQNRFNMARKDIEREPCLNPTSILVWTTVETVFYKSSDRWRDMGNGVFYLRTST